MDKAWGACSFDLRDKMVAVMNENEALKRQIESFEQKNLGNEQLNRWVSSQNTGNDTLVQTGELDQQNSSNSDQDFHEPG